MYRPTLAVQTPRYRATAGLDKRGARPILGADFGVIDLGEVSTIVWILGCVFRLQFLRNPTDRHIAGFVLLQEFVEYLG